MNTYFNTITDALNQQLDQKAIQEIQQNKALGEEVSFAKEMHFVNQHKEQIQVQETLSNILADLHVTPDNTLTDTLAEEGVIELPGKTSGANNTLWWLGGSLLIILTLSALFWMRPAENIFTEVQQSTLEMLSPLNAFTDYDLNVEKDNYSLGFDAYNKGDYPLAVTYLSNYIRNQPKDNQVRLYLSISQLFAGDYPESLVNLQTLDSDKNAFMQEHIHWYTSIAYLMNHETETALRKLESIQADNIHFADAKALLTQIINQ